MKINKEFQGLMKSFQFAFRGICFCLKNERNMRIHIVTAFFVSSFSIIYKLQPHEYMILTLAIVFVIVSEMLNTAIEALVDLETPAYDLLARIAKDVAAGAVLVSAISAVIVGIILFFKEPQKLLDTVLYIGTNPYLMVPAVLLFALGLLFIFRGFYLFSKIDNVKIYKTNKDKKDITIKGQDEKVKIYEIKSKKKDV